MNFSACQRSVLLAHGISLAVLAALGVVAAILAAGSAGVLIGVMVGWFLLCVAEAVIFATAFRNCSRRTAAAVG
jgi:hypothetical protein